MAFRRFRKRVGIRRKRRSAVSTWRRYGAKAGGLAYKAWRGVRYIKSLINVEKKFFDVTGTTTIDGTSSTSGSIISLSNIAQGDDYNNRSGNSILLQSLLFRGKATIASTFKPTTIRVMLLIDNDQRGTDPTFTDIFETGVGTNITRPLNHNVGKRFNVLWDRVTSMDEFNQRRFLHTFRKFYGQHIKYQGTAGADASAYEGNLYLVLASDVATSDAPSFDYSVRLRYTDN